MNLLAALLWDKIVGFRFITAIDETVDNRLVVILIVFIPDHLAGAPITTGVLKSFPSQCYLCG